MVEERDDPVVLPGVGGRVPDPLQVDAVEDPGGDVEDPALRQQFGEIAGEILLGPRHRPIYQADDRLIFKFISNRRSTVTRSTDVKVLIGPAPILKVVSLRTTWRSKITNAGPAMNLVPRQDTANGTGSPLDHV